MFGRKIGLFAACLALFPAVTVSVKKCQYVVELQTGYEYQSGTDDKIMIRIHKYGPWHALDNPGVDDFERGQTDTFKFEDYCIERDQEITIGSAGHGRFFSCLSNQWLLIYVKFYPEDRHWINEWATDKWISCTDKLKLKWKKRRFLHP